MWSDDQVACSVGNLINIDFEDNDNPKVKKVQADFLNQGTVFVL